MWIVWVFELTERKRESAENDRLEIVAQRATPRRNSYNRVPAGTENTLITVPFSEAVATLPPSLSNATAAKFSK